ncbi:hypothetical protein SPONN_1507 [uncultured Candidatus Thioglobus sp.]|nr:hypothetical protein SPONN_1507 [uncultured Candidatus Thioglobus sp.]
MWRSFPHLAFLFIVLFVSAFMKKSIVAQIEFINKFESEVVDNDGPSY